MSIHSKVSKSPTPHSTIFISKHPENHSNFVRSIHNFDPYFPRQITEQASLIAMEMLNISILEIIFPSDDSFKHITDQLVIENFISEHTQRIRELIRQIKMQRKLLIEQFQSSPILKFLFEDSISQDLDFKKSQILPRPQLAINDNSCELSHKSFVVTQLSEAEIRKRIDPLGTITSTDFPKPDFDNQSTSTKNSRSRSVGSSKLRFEKSIDFKERTNRNFFLENKHFRQRQCETVQSSPVHTTVQKPEYQNQQTFKNFSVKKRNFSTGNQNSSEQSKEDILDFPQQLQPLNSSFYHVKNGTSKRPPKKAEYAKMLEDRTERERMIEYEKKLWTNIRLERIAEHKARKREMRRNRHKSQ